MKTTANNEKWCKSLVFGSQLQLVNGVAGTVKSPIGHPLTSFSGTMTAILGAAGNGSPTQATWSIKFGQDMVQHFERGFLFIGCLRYFGGLHSTTYDARTEIFLNNKSIDGFNLRIKPPNHSDYFHRIPAPTLPDMSPVSDCQTTYIWPILKENLILSEYQNVSITIDSNTWWDIDYVGFLFCMDRAEAPVVHFGKKVWSDPVMSKIIATIIISIFTTVIGYFWFSQRKPQLMEKTPLPKETSLTEGNKNINEPKLVPTDDIDRNEKALKIIKEYVDDTCKNIQLNGTSDDFALTAKADANLKGVVSKIANLGFEGAAQYKKHNYNGLIQSDFVAALKNNYNCKVQITKILSEKLLVTVQKPNKVKTVGKNNDHPNEDHVVRIKTDTTPTSPDEALDPYKHIFVLKNSGELSAHIISVKVYESSASGNGLTSGRNAAQTVPKLDNILVALNRCAGT